MSARLCAVLLRLCALLVLLAGMAPARADTAIGLFASYDGRVNFTGTQVSWRAYANNDYYPQRACTIYTPTSTLTANLTIPQGATVLAAHLYWAGSGSSSSADYNVVLQNTPVSATRRHTSTTVGGGLNYFGAAADVTNIVKATGSGTYAFSGLTVSNGDPWCASQAVLGGFSLLVVYSHPSEPERVLNLYEGFRYVQNSTVNVSASNFRWATPALPVVEKARVGHITWEGDTTLSGGGERLMFEGKELTDTMNPTGNQFNSRSNINGDYSSYGVDFDAYDTTVTIWAGYDAVVNTSYQTGQDLVLLGAEVLVVPTLPVSDMSVKLTGPTELQVSVPAVYKIALTNNGPYTAPAGSLKATFTVPAGMSFASASGTNWSCTQNAQNVTCSYSGAVAPGNSSTELTLTNSVQTTGSKTSTVAVSMVENSGASDDKPNNNSASHTATAKAAPPPPSVPAYSYAFTKGACAPGIAIGAANSGCTYYTGPRIAGDTEPIYITARDVNDVPVALSKTAATPVPMKFSLTCVNPAANAGVKATYGNTELPLCTPKGEVPAAGTTAAWSSEVQVNYPMNTASVAYDFGYADVGSVQLNLLQGTKTASAAFISRPYQIGFRKIAREDVLNPGTTDPSGAGFAMAGEDVNVEVIALVKTADNSVRPAPNFGNETDHNQVALALTNKAANSDPKGTNYQANAGTFTTSPITWQSGAAVLDAQWSEVGATTFVASLTSYLGVSLSNAPLTVEKPVGRFYPAYYTTDLTGPLDCPLPGSGCPVDYNGKVPAVFASQEFTGVVVPRSVQGEEIRNFVGPWYRPVMLSAAAESAPGAPGAALARNFATPTPTATWPTPTSGTITGPLTYTVANPYDTNKPRANDWTAPTTVYLRAQSEDARLLAGGGSTPVLIRSMRDPEAISEGGIVVLNGRLKVGNAIGVDTLRTPVGVRAEYWNGTTWAVMTTYTDSLLMPGSNARFRDCTRGLASTAAPPNNCLAAVAGDPNTDEKVATKLTNGAGVVWMLPPGKLATGRSRDGSTSIAFLYRSWLPSTMGRVTFGSYRSPLIYIREVY